MQKIFEKLRIEILKTLDVQNSGFADSTINSLNKIAKKSDKFTDFPTEKGRIF